MFRCSFLLAAVACFSLDALVPALASAQSDLSSCKLYSGDSGGPVFYGGYESNVIVAVTSFGLNALCRGTDFAYRTDTEAVIEWILATVKASTTPAEYRDIQFTTI